MKADDFKPEHALYIVPTPVGNLEDITYRALKVLSKADIIASEDTRRTGALLKNYNIAPGKFESYHEHNEKEKASYLIGKIIGGNSVALVTDAGTPGISDPGYSIISEAIKNGIKVIPLPGATAFVPALAASGLPNSEFIFLGFPPRKKGRKKFMEGLTGYASTIILYESPHRVLSLARELAEYCGTSRRACFAREITKIHEEFIRGTLEECIGALEDKDAVKGEFVVLVEGRKT